MLCISSKVVPFTWQRPEWHREKLPHVFVKAKIPNFSQRKYRQLSCPWASEMMKDISYNSASCDWWTSIVGWSIYDVSFWLCLDDIWSSSQEGLKDHRPGFIISSMRAMCFFHTPIHTDEIFLCIPKSSHDRDQGIKIPGLWNSRLFLLSPFPTFTKHRNYTFLKAFPTFFVDSRVGIQNLLRTAQGFYTHIYTHREHNYFYFYMTPVFTTGWKKTKCLSLWSNTCFPF